MASQPFFHPRDSLVVCTTVPPSLTELDTIERKHFGDYVSNYDVFDTKFFRLYCESNSENVRTDTCRGVQDKLSYVTYTLYYPSNLTLLITHYSDKTFDVFERHQRKLQHSSIHTSLGSSSF